MVAPRPARLLLDARYGRGIEKEGSVLLDPPLARLSRALDAVMHVTREHRPDRLGGARERLG